jgi:heme A synthase
MHADGSGSGLGRFVTGVGIVEMLIGAAAWAVVSRRLADEKIVVPGSARWFPNRTVQDPLTALEEAEVVRQITLKATDGRTYGEMAADDPKSRLALDASLIRSSLFTAILAFGIAAMQVALGAVFVVIGRALTEAGIDRR